MARCVVVTGGDSGIGAACAEAFARDGCDVAITYHSHEERAQDVADRLRAAGGRAFYTQCSAEDAGSVERAFAAVEEAFGPAAVLVNSAGRGGGNAPLRDMEPEVFAQVIGSDLTGPFLVSRRFLRSCPDGAAIIHISSIHAQVGPAGGGDYAAAKSGLNRLVETLALEEAPRGIRVTAVEPGMILTPMNQAAMDDPEVARQQSAGVPLKRPGEASEVAALVRFLASDEARYITGTAITIDGGLSLVRG